MKEGGRECRREGGREGGREGAGGREVLFYFCLCSIFHNERKQQPISIS